MTTVTFSRTGGVVGNDLGLKLDLNTLPENEAERLNQLIDQADFFNLPENLAAQPSPDEFQYTLKVETGGDSHTIRCTDTSMPGNLRMLVKELTLLNIIHH